MPGNSQYHVIDIGMNVGISSLYFSNLEQVDRVYAFEPFLPTYSLAVLNFELNKHLALNIKPNNYGLGFKKESLTVKYNSENKGINSSLIDNPRIQSGTKEKILIKPAYNIILEIIKQNPQKEFIIKIDTEGYEPQVLIGAKELITRDKPIIYIELGGDHQQTSAESLKILKELNYSCEADDIDLTNVYAGNNFLAFPK